MAKLEIGGLKVGVSIDFPKKRISDRLFSEMSCIFFVYEKGFIFWF